jgi:superfamily II RNA helicase
MEKKQSWAQKNPERIKEHKKRYYQKNLEEAKRRSKIQNLRGKIAYNMLSDSDKKKCDKEVEKLLT